MQPHRIGQLRWQASTSGTEAALALRSRLHGMSERVHAALEHALDAVDPGDPTLTLHLRRMNLRLPLAALEGDDETLDGAVRAAVLSAWQLLRATPALDEATMRGDCGMPAGRDPAAADLPLPPAMESHLLAYLATAVLPGPLAALPAERVQVALRAAALALGAQGDPLRLGVRAGDLTERVGWFRRLLELWPAAERRDWMRRQLEAAQGHAMAASPLHEALDKRLFDTSLPDALRVQLKALWLAVMAPGAVSLDAERREHDQESASRLLQHWLAQPPSASASAPPPTDNLTDDALRWSAEEPAARTEAHAAAGDAAGWAVPMAGLVLLHPWLPGLLKRCGIISRSDISRLDGPALARAGGLLHWLATGREQAPELELPLIKLLLGQPPELPWTLGGQPPGESDRAEGAALLALVLGQWSPLQASGVDGLRAGFLQRRGRLVGTPQRGGWLLRPEPESFDSMLGMLPWGIGWVRLPWMPEALATDWAVP